MSSLLAWPAASICRRLVLKVASSGLDRSGIAQNAKFAETKGQTITADEVKITRETRLGINFSSLGARPR